MKKKILILMPIVAMTLAGCGGSKTSGQITDSTGTSGITKPDDGGHKSKDISSALAYDYSNVTLFTGVSYNDGASAVVEYQYYDDDHIVVFSNDLLETYGSEYLAKAYSEYYVVDDKCYMWLDAQKDVENSKGGWLTNGFQNADLAIWRAYFYLPHLLESLEPEDFTYILGDYFITDREKNAEVIEYVFSWLFYVDFLNLPVDMSFQVDPETGAFKKIVAYLDDKEDSENYVLIEFSDIGKTTLPTVEGFSLHEAPNENNTTTYWQYYGWESDYVTTYYTDLSISVGTESNDFVTVSEDKRSVTAKLDKTFAVDLLTTPLEFKPWELVPYANQEIVYEYDKTILREDYDYNHNRVFQTIKPGTTTIRAKVLGETGYIYSNEITVTVEESDTQNLENAIYKFSWIGFTDPEEPNRIYASNDYANGLPCTITALETTGTKILDGKNGDITENGKNYLCFSPQQASNPAGGPGAESAVLFDFGDQQVNEFSFYFDLFYGSQKSEFFKTFKSMTISTSNDGETWSEIDITNTIKDELSVEFWKLCDVKFEPASMVKVALKATMHGGNGTLCLDSVAFSADDTCNKHGQSTSVPVTGVMLSATSLDLEIGETVKPTALVMPDNATNKAVTWASDNEDVATVASDGTITGISAGDANITVTTVDGNFSKTCGVTVSAKPTIPAEYAGLYLCDSKDATIVLDAENSTCTYKKGDYEVTLPLKKLENRTMTFTNGVDKIVAVKETGGLYLSTGGDSVINGTALAGTWNFTQVIEATDFSIKVSGITKDSNGNYPIKVGKTVYVYAENIKPSDANVMDVEWKVINGTGEATFDDEYNSITATKAGLVTLKATMNGKIVKEVQFDISEPVKPTQITITGNNTVEVGDSVTLKATVLPEDADNKEVTWVSDNESVATVSSKGVVNGISAGTATITAFSKADSIVVGEFEITVTEPSEEVIPSALVGDWEFSDEIEETCEGGQFSLDASGSLYITIDDCTVEFSLTSKSNGVYSFDGVDDYVEAKITFVGDSIELLWIDDGNCIFYYGCELTFTSVTKL